MLKEGDAAPDFSLMNEAGEEINLKDFRGKKVIVYFYPKDDTPGCTKEACDFRENFDQFKKKNAVILGISKDNMKSHQKFKSKYNLPFTLLSDENLIVLKKYDVWKEKSMFGKKYMGIERTTFLIHERGKIEKIYPKVKVEGHISEILNQI